MLNLVHRRRLYKSRLTQTAVAAPPVVAAIAGALAVPRIIRYPAGSPKDEAPWTEMV
ncbi:unnamed protein product [Arabidopsis arenosa]|uniref:Uncharacterized protein n=1 Tax=Arabidopsis arenosa TaxID=38785 RepID=A0A8S2A5W2_ARAAE|nr:unnamed protein product [Arabidopsis arenosa]